MLVFFRGSSRDDPGVGRFQAVEDVEAAAGTDGRRGVDPEAPADDVNAVDAVVADLTGAPVSEPVPVVVESVHDERTVQHRLLPESVINARGGVVAGPRMSMVRF